MPDYLTTVTAENELKDVTKEEALALAQGLGLNRKEELPRAPHGECYGYSHDQSAYTIEWDEKTGELYIFAEDFACTGQVPVKFWRALAKLLVARKMKFLEFGWASHCSKTCMGAYGGGSFRVYNDGELIYADLVHPRHKTTLKIS